MRHFVYGPKKLGRELDGALRPLPVNWSDVVAGAVAVLTDEVHPFLHGWRHISLSGQILDIVGERFAFLSALVNRDMHQDAAGHELCGPERASCHAGPDFLVCALEISGESRDERAISSPGVNHSATVYRRRFAASRALQPSDRKSLRVNVCANDRTSDKTAAMGAAVLHPRLGGTPVVSGNGSMPLILDHRASVCRVRRAGPPQFAMGSAQYAATWSASAAQTGRLPMIRIVLVWAANTTVANRSPKVT
jgi:hypothetical protein